MGGRDLAGLPSRVERFIGSDLLKVEQIFHTELASPNPYVADIFTHVAHFRGKRLRPMLLLLSASATGPIAESHRILAAVVEMIHTATLVHDDVLDEAETRRHVATVNTRWNNETSVLFGDYLFTHAFHLASSLETTLACRLIGRATNIVCEGELTQIRERGNLELSEEAYLRIIDGKTAELCAVSCYLGAHYAEAEESISKSLEQYGRCARHRVSDLRRPARHPGIRGRNGQIARHGFQEAKTDAPLDSPLEPDRRTRICLLARTCCAGGRRGVVRSHPLAASQRRGRILPRPGRLEFAAAARSHLQDLNDSSAKRILLEITEFATHRTY